METKLNPKYSGVDAASASADQQGAGRGLGRPAISDSVRRVGGALALPQVLAGNGVDPSALLAEFGLAPATFADAENLIPANLIGRLGARAVELTGLADFGLRVGMQTNLRALGLLGYLANSAETVEAALNCITDFYQIQSQAVVPFLSRRGSEAVFGYDVLEPASPGADQLTFGSLASMLNFLRELCGPGFRPREVCFAYAAPADTSLFRSLFGANLRFDSSSSAMLFDAAYLDRRPPGADPVLHGLLLSQARQQNSSGNLHQVMGRISRVMQTLLAAGRFSEEEVARCFGMNRRTLSRRLRAGGITYQTLLDQVRFDLARQLLGDSRVAMSEIASQLGFADSVTFTRAFRRWSGTPPGRWRREQQSAQVS